MDRLESAKEPALKMNIKRLKVRIKRQLTMVLYDMTVGRVFYFLF